METERGHHHSDADNDQQGSGASPCRFVGALSFSMFECQRSVKQLNCGMHFCGAG